MTHPRDKYQELMEQAARRTFRNHVVTLESCGRWLLRDPEHRGLAWAEVICTHGGGLIVEGDIDPVVFRYGPKDDWARVSWMGRRAHAWDSYFRQKAHIGMGGSECIETWDPEVASADLDDYILDCANDETPEPRLQALGAVQETLGSTECTRGEFVSEMAALGIETEDWSDMGTIPTPRMFNAHALLQRLSHILMERDSR